VVNNYGIIANGIVVNAVLAEADFAAEQGWVLLPEGVGLLWLYNGKSFSAPLPYIPPKEVQEAARAAAYTLEADPIFFKAQRGEATEAEWFAIIADIKARFPYPSE
jgi:hypothetical protein